MWQKAEFTTMYTKTFFFVLSWFRNIIQHYYVAKNLIYNNLNRNIFINCFYNYKALFRAIIINYVKLSIIQALIKKQYRTKTLKHTDWKKAFFSEYGTISFILKIKNNITKK